MNKTWQKRFFTWGIFIAVFGMRLLFPLILISVFLHTSPINALHIAIKDPPKFAALMLSAKVSISAFGGAFLLLVALKYFFDIKKKTYWIEKLERPLNYLGRVETFKIAITLVFLYSFSLLQKGFHKEEFLVAGLWESSYFCSLMG